MLHKRKRICTQYFWNGSAAVARADILSGITVALALLPEAIAFAFVAGVSPLVSLQTAVMIGIIAALFSGRPGMISSSTAAIAIVVAPLVATYGMEYLFATVVLMGIIQLTIGVLKWGKYTSIIPHSVVLGFLNGLAIVIFLAQLDQFTYINQAGEQVWLATPDMLMMIGFVLLTMAIIYLFPRINKTIPSTLVAIASVTGVSVILASTGVYELATVADFAGGNISGALPSFHIPAIPLTRETLTIIFPFALVGALVGLTEATLTLRVLDDMTDTKGKMNREYIAQGLANFANGWFGGMGGDAMIGQSIVNITSGGRARLSGLIAASALLGFLLFAAPVVNAIPLASLVGLMFVVVISTFKRETLKYRGKIPMQDIIVIIVVSGLTVFIDLATAVIVGVLLSTLMFAREKGKSLTARRDLHTDKQIVHYHIQGIVFFGSSHDFKDLFVYEQDPDTIIVDLAQAKIMDQSAIQALSDVNNKYYDLGKKLRIIHASHRCQLLLRNAQPLLHPLDVEG